MARNAAKFAFGVALFVAFAQAGTIALAWWRGELPQPSLGDWLWMLSLPVLIVIYLRWFSVLRPGCRSCVVDEPRSRDGPRGP